MLLVAGSLYFIANGADISTVIERRPVILSDSDAVYAEDNLIETATETKMILEHISYILEQ